MDPRSTVAIVGAGPCGAVAAITLREDGFDGRVLLIGDEPEVPYERPPLSKAFLRGKQAPDQFLVYPDSWYAAYEINLVSGVRVERLDLAARALELADGRRVASDRVLLATGGRPRLLPGVPPSDRVVYLRTLADATRLSAHLSAGSRVVVIGAGFIGCEVAASARRLGCEVTVLEPLDVPMERAVGREIGALFAGIHRDEGVDLHLSEGVTGVREIGGAVQVETTRGVRIEGDVVVVGIGLQPNVELAADAGIPCDDGIVVDKRCRTAIDAVYAAGDVARHTHPLFGDVRVEHHDNALRQGAAAAHSLLGHDAVFDDPHWFWSDQYDHNLQSVGIRDAWDDLVVRGSLDARDFTVFYLRDQHIRSAIALNRGHEVLRARRLMRANARIDPNLLGDESVDVRKAVVR
jgi:3-phenylpropionate/trans-cinnamate dioxygenase ferredoxin reductase subunit